MGAAPELQIASAAGNVFGYVFAEDAPVGFDGAAWARRLCPRGRALGLDGLFLVGAQQPGRPWCLEHWDADGARSFCGNGTRAALALRGAPEGADLQAVSNDERVRLRREGDRVGLQMPEGEGYGFRTAALDLPGPWAYGWVGNPQLVVEVPEVGAVDLPAFAPPLRHHPALPAGANVNVLEPRGDGEARIRSWERGVEGETLCCGTGCAVAGAWLAKRTGIHRWTFETAGGEAVTVDVAGLEGERWRDLWISGPVRRIATVHPDAALLRS